VKIILGKLKTINNNNGPKLQNLSIFGTRPTKSKLKSISSAIKICKIKVNMKINLVIQKNNLNNSDISSLSIVTLSAENILRNFNIFSADNVTIDRDEISELFRLFF
jgi:hypothetical protein